MKTLDDIEREKHNEKREKVKREISEDVNDVIGNIIGKPRIKREKGFGDYLISFLKWFGIVMLLIIIINIILGNIWLLRFFIKDLFMKG